MLSKNSKSTEVDRKTWLHVLSGTPWSTSSDIRHVVETLDKIKVPSGTGQGIKGSKRPPLASCTSCKQFYQNLHGFNNKQHHA